MDLVSGDVSGDSHVMSVVILQGVGIFNLKHLLILIGDYDRLRARRNALLGAGFR